MCRCPYKPVLLLRTGSPVHCEAHHRMCHLFGKRCNSPEIHDWQISKKEQCGTGKGRRTRWCLNPKNFQAHRCWWIQNQGLGSGWFVQKGGGGLSISTARIRRFCAYFEEKGKYLKMRTGISKPRWLSICPVRPALQCWWRE